MPLTTRDIDFLRQVVAHCSGHVISDGKEYLIETRLQPVAQSAGLLSVGELVNELRCGDDPLIRDRVAEAMTINETFFFRDSHPFETLRTLIVPELVRVRQSVRRLSVWCAACSSGQEPYSVAMTLREQFPELHDWNVNILATDISDEMLHNAQEGRFSQFEVNRGLPPKLLNKYFDREEASWRVKEEIRRMLEFRKINLSKAWPFIPTCDIVFMRNVLIYFSTRTKESIIARLRRIVAEDAYVILGSVETLRCFEAQFTQADVAGSIFYRPAQ